ncbi:hypothetical protein SARC_09482 [Sphaeroforma arctica JP610]|uniref:Uncharacterized protein n=1 Tax=Sphaeroforma arctica JP610 TaxID=667725 RepID=A0A0L0FMV2_9EUKA|nr:hypothetical protein SARC_09482 [Sphaeroforma arctica JP610]KNC78074.1 hypothetical protein SARC_09482 [Sphaeroforma arctica JP610]|eukprot:XP_014151976.1 hypothetical protein SARC_09482 [Sphaeroforma arctica JP610]
MSAALPTCSFTCQNPGHPGHPGHPRYFGTVESSDLLTDRNTREFQLGTSLCVGRGVDGLIIGLVWCHQLSHGLACVGTSVRAVPSPSRARVTTQNSRQRSTSLASEDGVVGFVLPAVCVESQVLYSSHQPQTSSPTCHPTVNTSSSSVPLDEPDVAHCSTRVSVGRC